MCLVLGAVLAQVGNGKNALNRDWFKGGGGGLLRLDNAQLD